jgi:cytochrome c553
MRAALLVVLALPSAVSAMSPAPPPPQIGLCASCHRDDGRSGDPGTPRLAGQDETYLRVALDAYRRGRRDHAAMRAIAGALSDNDIAAFAAWYASRPPAAPPTVPPP